MIDIYFNKKSWQKAYQKRENRVLTWVVLESIDGEDIYIKNYTKWDTDFLKWCKDNQKVFKKVGLQYKTHRFMIDCGNYDSIYVIRSAFGKIGSVPRDCFSLGIVNNGIIDKKIISTPELLELDQYTDNIAECFEEGFLHRNEKRKTKLI